MRSWLFVAITLSILVSSTPAIAQSDTPRHSSWTFDNFQLPDVLPWSTYRRTYLNIPSEPAPGDSRVTPDIVFYDQLYNNLASKYGNCFGMVLMSLLMNRDGEHMGFCLPVNQYSGATNAGPINARLSVAINMMLGHQLNLANARYQLDLIASGNATDPQYAYNRFQSLKQSGEYVLVSITESLSPQDGGHTVVGYRTEDLGSQKRRIYVYDPNRPYSTDRAWYDSNSNYIAIDHQTWSFLMAGNTTPWSGGYINVIPVSLVGAEDRTPASLGVEAIGMIMSTLVLSGANTSVDQVTDGRGRRLYRPGTRQVDTDPLTGMRTMVPMVISGASDPKQRATYLVHFGPSAGALNVTVKADNSGYTLTSAAGKTVVAVAARGGNGSETVTLRYPASREAGVVINNARGTSDYDVRLARIDSDRSKKVFSSTRLKVVAGAPVDVTLVDRARAIRIASPKSAIQYDLEIQSVRGAKRESLTTRVNHESGAVRQIRPKDWKNLKNGGLSDQKLKMP